MPGQLAPQGRPIQGEAKALAAAHAVLEKQAEQVVVVDLRSLSSVTDFFVICTAGSSRQIDALKDHIEAVLSGQGWPVWHTEGDAAPPSRGFTLDPQWVLMDYGDLVVHVMDQKSRSFYQLEQLWADAPRVPLAQAPSR